MTDAAPPSEPKTLFLLRADGGIVMLPVAEDPVLMSAACLNDKLVRLLRLMGSSSGVCSCWDGFASFSLALAELL